MGPQVSFRATLLIMASADWLTGGTPSKLRVDSLPLTFEQTGAGSFLAQAPGSALTLDRQGLVLTRGSRAIRMRIVGGRGEPVGDRPLVAAVTRFEGQQVRTSHLFERVRFNAVYPGIDLVFYGRKGMLEYDFVVKPGARPSDIRFELDSALPVVGADGSLELNSGAVTVRWNPPLLYEQESGRNISGAFVVRGRQVRFECGRYDKSKTLVIDPVLNYVSYLGSTGNEIGYVATDNQGNFYLAGPTTSQDLKVTAGVFRTAHAGQTSGMFAGDVYIAKFDSSGALVWLTYLGGSGDDSASAVAVDGGGNVYVAGATNSKDFPLKNAAQSAYGGQGGVAAAVVGDAFVAKLNPAGSQLIYSTYLGGRLDDAALNIEVDSAGNAYVGGVTLSRDFPVTPGVLQSTFKGQGGQPVFPKLDDVYWDTGDGFVAKYDPNGALKWATYIGGSLDDAIRGMAVDAAQNVYVSGYTLSSDFPVTASAPQKTYGGFDPLNYLGNFGDGFIAKISPDGSKLLYSTYLGGRGDDAVTAIAVDGNGQVHATGFTTSANFFTTPNAFQRAWKGAPPPFYKDFYWGDAFYTKLSADGSSFVYSTMFGGTDDDIGTGIAIDPSGNIIICGMTYGPADFPIFGDPIQKDFQGGKWDSFLFEFDGNGKRIYGGLFGGPLDDAFVSIAVDSSGTIFIAGSTLSNNLPVTSNASQKVYGGGITKRTRWEGDVVVLRLSASGGTVTPPNGVSSIVNGASLLAGNIAPGMQFTASGLALGGTTAAGSTIGAGRILGTVAGNTRLLFDGTPAPLLSASATSISGYVPFNVQGKSTVQVVAEVSGVRLPALSVAVSDSIPGVFTADGSGLGPALSYNIDGSVNSAGVPAARGTTLTFYITGGGVTNPPATDGQLLYGMLPSLAQSLTVTIGGSNSPVLRAITMPFEVAGIIEVTVTVPDDPPSGPVALYVIGSNGVSSQGGVTVTLQ